MATKLDFFFQVFSALLAGAHSPEKGGDGGGEGGSTEETATATAATAQGGAAGEGDRRME